MRGVAGIATRGVSVLTALIYGYFITQAVLTTATGALMPNIVATFGMSLFQVGLLGSLSATGGLLAILAGSFVADRVGKYRLLALSAGLGGAGTLAAALATGLSPFLAIGFVRGGSFGLYNLAGNALMADLHPERRGLFVGLLHALFGTGALLGPMIATGFVATGGTWATLYGALALLQIAVTLLFLAAIRSAPPEQLSGARQTAGGLGPARVLVPVCLGMAFYTASQTTMITWLPTFLQKQAGLPASLASSALSAFWLGMVGGRIAAMWISDRTEGRAVLLTMSGAGALFTAASAFVAGPSALLAAVFLAGLFTGGIWPQALSYVYGLLPHASGRVTGAITVASGVAGIFLPLLTGAVAQQTSLRGAMLTGLAYVSAAMLAFAFLPRYYPPRARRAAS